MMPIIPDFSVGWRCGFCGTEQKVYVGDPEDLSLPDVEAVRCCSCKRLELMNEADFRLSKNLYDDEDKPIPITHEVIEEYAYVEDGFK
jgi:hypothetical protein